MLVEMDLEPASPPALVLNTPFHFSKCSTGAKDRPPYLGEHNKIVFKELLGLDENEVETLLRDRVIFEDRRVA
jgi:crotonobetainyl-CoA:carnitine CoA-transferase CaiB-like acyl-CoA transferase